ncbi:flagellar filament capping protein FliD [Shewanella sp. 4t3-1-2LB]|uniref:flagellar filament capping protein FliD n=1 Tax=Shewanella sp. 4t3-1-2LB TaxID=2817682 RepID=UPI001A99DC57|nr:flagellar filament capping protein FliD [Shewanella sp. 4t3-1-2LB]MBO1272396.1 flagellar filament capping protein FliD [Shewanella sp. 4t3-1-2LB]
MASLTANGLGSGLDISGIVTALVNAEKAPKTAALDADQATITAKVSAIGSLKSAISGFLDKLSPLSKTDTFGGFKAKLSNNDYLTATASTDAVAGSYKVVVEQLAESQKLGSAAVSDVTAGIGSGSVAFTVNGDSFNVDVAATDSLQDIVKKINSSEDNVGITATIVNSDSGAQLVLTSNKTGTDNQIQVATSADSEAALTNTFTMTTLQSAKDSIIYVDGLKVTSDSNTVDDAITGVTLNLTDADVNKSSTLTISQDTATPKSAIKDFVDAYNSMMTTVSNLSSYNADTEKAAVLLGDSTIRSIQSQFRTAISSMFDTGDGKTTALTNLGISTTRDGTLEIDDDKLSAALEKNPSQVSAFFTTEDTGFAAKLQSIGDAYTQTGGILDSRNDSLNNQLDRIGDQREQLDLKMQAYQARLTKQYNAMDLMVGQLNSQNSMISDRLASLPGLVSSNKN